MSAGGTLPLNTGELEALLLYPSRGTLHRDICRTIVFLSYMKLHNAWLLKTSSKKKKKKSDNGS